MQKVLAFTMPGPFEFVVILAWIVIPIAILFAVVFFAVKLATKSKRAQQEPQQR